jgi:glutamine cyclotransferase
MIPLSFVKLKSTKTGRPMKIRLTSFIIILLILNMNHSCRNSTKDSGNTDKTIPVIDYSCTSSYPHDKNSFTEGFLVHDGILFESTGSFKNLPQTRSLFGTVDLKTGSIDLKAEIDKKKYCGEGITILNGKVFQLTYQTRVGFVYDAVSFKKINEFALPNDEGWGLTTDGTSLIMSDGTNVLTCMDPETFNVIRTIQVSAGGYRIKRLRLNELEYIKGFVYANMWPTSTILKIDLADGKVTGKLILDSITNDAINAYKHSCEMNGIAYDSVSDRIFVTGKLWPKIYEIRLRN